jgi:hypothetical protein
LFFAPSCADRIGIYDLSSGTFGGLAIREAESSRHLKFHTVFAHKEYVFFFGFSYPAIIKLNTVTWRMTYISDWIEPLKRFTVNDDKLYLGAGCVNGNSVVLPAQSANAVVCFDMETCVSSIWEIPSRNSGYDDICYDGEHYWLASRHSRGSVIKWNPAKGVTELDIPGGWADGDYWTVCYAGGYAWYLPMPGNTAFKVNTTSDEIETAEPFMPECLIRSNEGNPTAANYYFAPKALDNVIYAHTGKSNTRISYNANTGERREEKIIVSAEDRKKIISDTMLNHGDKASIRTIKDCVFTESETFTLHDFLDRLMNGSEETWNKIKEAQTAVCLENIANADGTAGQKIYDELKRTILG